MQRATTGKGFSAIRKLGESRDGMTDLQKLRQWLKTFPQWEDTLLVENLEPEPGNAGVFPGGLEEVGRRMDVLGNLQVECRLLFSLYRRTPRPREDEKSAQWLLDFQNWVQQQSTAGLAPHFGDVPSRERMQAQKGTLKERAQTGTYVVTLIADFMKVYEVKE